MKNTYEFKHVYLQSSGCVCGPLEAQGPLKHKIDYTYEDLYCNQDSFEAAEREMMAKASDLALRKGNLKLNEVDCIFGGDLINQLGISNYFARNTGVPFVGLYGACSNSVLLALQSGIWIEAQMMKKTLCVTSSHNSTAERQFRYPNEYGIQKRPTTTFTVTGSGAMIFGREKSDIQMTSGTLGKIIDWNFTDVNDMGSAMAPAAFSTIQDHFKNTGTSFDDYDQVLTGDLSSVGLAMLKECFLKEGVDPKDKLDDCGLIIYDRDKQPQVFAGGSGCGCSSIVTISHIFDKIRKKEWKKVLVVATGALLDPILTYQKESIPCIAHAVVYEGVE